VGNLLVFLSQASFVLSVINTLSPVTADVIEGIVSCNNHEDCIGANRRCDRNKTSIMGTCMCKHGYEEKKDSEISCVKKKATHQCLRDTDCREGEVCIIVRAPYTKERVMINGEDFNNQKICIGTWLIYTADFEEPKTGGGLRSKFYPDDFFFKRGRRVPQQYLGFVEDMMLILFLVCILVTLVTVHRASCYRQFQDARRNTPLRHIIPIAADQPPPYSERRDTVDALAEIVSESGSCSSSGPKRYSETPPPTYEEALYRNSVLLPQNSTVEAQTHDQQSLDSELPSYNETRVRVFENLHHRLSTVNAGATVVTINTQSGEERQQSEESSLLPPPQGVGQPVFTDQTPIDASDNQQATTPISGHPSPTAAARAQQLSANCQATAESYTTAGQLPADVVAVSSGQIVAASLTDGQATVPINLIVNAQPECIDSTNSGVNDSIKVESGPAGLQSTDSLNIAV